MSLCIKILLTFCFLQSINGFSRFGEPIDGRIAFDRSRVIDGEMWLELPSCSWYDEHPGSCDPLTPYSPCNFCKAFKTNIFGSADCPGIASLPARFQSLYEWRIKSHKRKTKTGAYYLCVLESREEPLPKMIIPNSAFQTTYKLIIYILILMIYFILI